MKKRLCIIFTIFSSFLFSQEIAVLKYNGGGDWYANPTSLPNLAKFCNQNIHTQINTKTAIVEASSGTLSSYPFIHMTGHGNVVFNPTEIINLKNYLLAGGFLHIDDNYGMDPYVRVAVKKLFPDQQLIELPFDHPVYQQAFAFRNGLPKIHKHDDHPPQGFGIFWEGRLVIFYSFECDLGDGWEDPDVHNDTAEARRNALQMGANLVRYAFTQ